MKRVHATESLAEIGHLKNLLEQAGIACTIKNETLSGGLGEISFLDCLPELWILEDAKLTEARQIVAQSQAHEGAADAWRCRHCGETNEGQFAACWNCGHADKKR